MNFKAGDRVEHVGYPEGRRPVWVVVGKTCSSWGIPTYDLYQESDPRFKAKYWESMLVLSETPKGS